MTHWVTAVTRVRFLPQKSAFRGHHIYGRTAVRISRFTDWCESAFLGPFHFPSWQSSRTGAPAPPSWSVTVGWGAPEGRAAGPYTAVWTAAVNRQDPVRAPGKLGGHRALCVLTRHRNEGLSAHRRRGRQGSAMHTHTSVSDDWAPGGILTEHECDSGQCTWEAGTSDKFSTKCLHFRVRNKTGPRVPFYCMTNTEEQNFSLKIHLKVSIFLQGKKVL